MLRKNALSSTSSTDCELADGRISLRLNQSANAIGRKWPTSITSVACPLITAEPKMPASPPATSMLSFSSTMSMISSTTSPIERPSSANTRIGWAPEVAILPQLAAVGELDLVGGDFLQPGDQPERHSLGLVGAGAEHQKRGQLFGGAGAHGRVLFGDSMRSRAGSAERLGDAVGIDDHDHGAVAQDGIAGEHVDVAQFCGHRLDHDFLGVEHAVDHNAEGLAADLGHHDKAVFRIGRGAVVELEQLLQVHQRQ